MPRFTVNYEDNYDQRPPACHQPPPPPPQQQSMGFGIVPHPLILLLCIPVFFAVFRPVVFTMPGGNQPVIINNKNG